MNEVLLLECMDDAAPRYPRTGQTASLEEVANGSAHKYGSFLKHKQHQKLPSRVLRSLLLRALSTRPSEHEYLGQAEH